MIPGLQRDAEPHTLVSHTLVSHTPVPHTLVPAHGALRAGFLIFASLLFALACALATHRLLQSPQQYPQLVTGALAWNASSKGGEPAAALAFMLALPVALWSLRVAADAYRQQGLADLGALQLACVPGAVWFAQTLMNPLSGMSWLFVAAALIGWWTVGAWVTRWSRGGAGAEGAMALMLVPLLAGFSALGVLYFLNRALLVPVRVPAFPVGYLAGVVVVIVSLHRSRGDSSPRVDWRRLALLSQLAIPLLALGVIPTPLMGDTGLTRIQSVSLPLAALSALAAIAVLLDIVRTARGKAASIDLRSATSFASPLALLLCVWILRSPFTTLPFVPVDDWHFGELLLPWAGWRDFGLVPYADLMPVRGFISLADAGLSALFMTGSAADVALLRPALALLYSGVVFFAMRYGAGTGAALVAITVLDFASPLTRIDYLYVAGASVQVGLMVRGRNPAASLFWLFSSLVFFAVAPGQGMLYTAATMPLLLYAAFNSSMRGRGWLVAAAAFTFACVALLALVSPTFREIWAGVRFYFADNVTINTVGSGIPWSESFTGSRVGNPVVREVFRAFCLVVGACMAWAATRAWLQPGDTLTDSKLRNALQRLNRLEIAVPVSVLATVIVFLPRVLGRIDADVSSRIGALTLLACALTPLVARRRGDAAVRGALAVAAIFLASAAHVSADASSEGSTSLSTNALRIPRQFNVADGLVHEPVSQLHRVGRARFDSAHLGELQHIRRLLDEMLPARTSYYDFTNHNARYVYFDRPPATRWTSPYYLADERAQARTAAELASARVPLLLLHASNFELDGGSAALRAYWLYRFALADYVPFDRDGYVFAVRRDLAARPEFAAFVQGGAAPMVLFDRVFAVSDLRSLPAAWGASVGTLDPSFTSVHRDAKLVASGDLVTRLEPVATSDSKAALPRFDVLRVELQCAVSEAPMAPMHLTWSARSHDTTTMHRLALTPASGVLLIPVGSRPTWILADEITDVRLERDDAGCQVTGARWLQRKRPG
ncbi:MAG: hypothetical protein V4617_03155 [Gemmatimonadota bacterium]